MENLKLTGDLLKRLQQRAAQEHCSVETLLSSLLDQRQDNHVYRHVLDHMTDTVVMFDRDLRYVYANPIIGKLTGFDPADMIGKTDAELGMPQDLVGQWQAAWQQVIETGQERLVTFTFETPEGPGHFESRLIPIFDDDGTLHHLLAVTRNVTGHIHIEEALSTSKAMYQSLVDSLPISIYRVDVDGRITFANRSLLESLGLSMDEVRGQSAYDLYPEELAAKYRRNDGQVMRESRTMHFIEENVSPQTGERRYVEVLKIPIYDQQGAVAGVQGVFWDITEGKRAEQRLIENERLISAVLRAVPSFIYIYDFIEDRNVFANSGLTTLLGFTPEELQAMGSNAIPRLVHPDDMKRLIGGIARAKAASDDYHYKISYRLKHKDGSWHWIQDQGIIFKRTPEGEVQQILGSVISVDELKRTEADLIETRKRYAMLANLTTEGIVLHHRGQIHDANQAFLDMFGYTFDELRDRQVIDLLFTPATCSIVHTNQERAISPPYEVEGVRKDGTCFPVEIEARQIHPTLRVATLRDITERKRGQEAALENERLRTRFQKEQERNALIQRVIFALSHDLRTPLTVISTSKDILARYYDRMTPEKRQEKLNGIGRHIQYALNLLEDTVTMIRGDLNEAEFHPTPINLAALCRVSVDEAGAAQKAQLHFLNIAQVETVTVDEVLISRILLNLLSNAIKYSQDDDEIRLELDRRERWVVLRVIDHGMGIDPEDLPYIFDPFFRSDGVHHISGTGLGLSIVKDCVERHRGRISVDSTPGEGTTFTVELPVP